MAFIRLTAVYVMKWDLCGTQKTRFDSSFFFFFFFLPAVFCSVYYNLSALSQIQLVYSATLGIMHDCYLACRKVQIMLV